MSPSTELHAVVRGERRTSQSLRHASVPESHNLCAIALTIDRDAIEPRCSAAAELPSTTATAAPDAHRRRRSNTTLDCDRCCTGSTHQPQHRRVSICAAFADSTPNVAHATASGHLHPIKSMTQSAAAPGFDFTISVSVRYEMTCSA